jgi:hypothetical protein
VQPAQATAHPRSRLLEVLNRGSAHCGGDLRHARAEDSPRSGNTRLDRRGGQLHVVPIAEQWHAPIDPQQRVLREIHRYTAAPWTPPYRRRAA